MAVYEQAVSLFIFTTRRLVYSHAQMRSITQHHQDNGSREHTLLRPLPHTTGGATHVDTNTHTLNTATSPSSA